ncbi:MAG: CinA family nicotinamide mononucleotide deamidase-related protein [Syntrophobacterales bacterium]|nr:CinA family nicotinamide mononucleotide deamidase-related protein [Syntrophobacterales bacterium]
MKVGILTIGNELTSGKIQDTNSAMIARAIQLQGWVLMRMMSVGDDNDAIHDALSYMLSHVEALVVTGGLGPTADDITTAAVASSFGLELQTDEAVLAYVRSIFANRGLRWTENNAKQAVFPAGARIIANPSGTAAGFALYRAGKIIAVIPGVPREAQKMLFEGVIPLFRETFPGSSLHVKTSIFRLSGIAESAVDEAIVGDNLAEAGIGVGFYPNFPENQLVLTVREKSAEAASEKLAAACKTVEMRLGKYIFARGEESLAGNIAKILTEKKLTLSTAESCTGGLIANRLTDIPGSSVFFERGAVSYSNESKVALLGVPEGVINAQGAVSEETARLMAEGIRRSAGTDLGLSVTGIAGPDGGTVEKPVGTTFIALATGDQTFCRHYAFRWDRRRNRTIASESALLMLWRYLTGGLGDAG